MFLSIITWMGIYTDNFAICTVINIRVENVDTVYVKTEGTKSYITWSVWSDKIRWVWDESANKIGSEICTLFYKNCFIFALNFAIYNSCNYCMIVLQSNAPQY